MPITGFILIGVGFVIGFVAFVGSVVNMLGGGGSVRDHGAWMLVMAGGGLVSGIGVLVAIVQAIQTYG
jgi:hypothetical protein